MASALESLVSPCAHDALHRFPWASSCPTMESMAAGVFDERNQDPTEALPSVEFARAPSRAISPWSAPSPFNAVARAPRTPSTESNQLEADPREAVADLTALIATSLSAASSSTGRAAPAFGSASCSAFTRSESLPSWLARPVRPRSTSMSWLVPRPS